MTNGGHVRLRREGAGDHVAVHALHVAAFGSSLEADLVDALRPAASPLVSLVADASGLVTGHILFSPVVLPGHDGLRLMGLGPMAVLPARQRAGIGSALVRAGLEACRDIGAGAIVVLGHPRFYPRFGFAPAARLGLRCAYDAPEDAFMVVELERGHLDGATGIVAYHPAFDRV